MTFGRIRSTKPPLGAASVTDGAMARSSSSWLFLVSAAYNETFLAVSPRTTLSLSSTFGMVCRRHNWVFPGTAFCMSLLQIGQTEISLSY